MTQDDLVNRMAACEVMCEKLGCFSGPCVRFAQLVAMAAEHIGGSELFSDEAADVFRDEYAAMLQAAEIACGMDDCHRDVIDLFVVELVQWAHTRLEAAKAKGRLQRNDDSGR